MKKFLYVFSKEERDKLLEMGCVLLKSYEKGETYVFENNDKLCYDLKDIYAYQTNVLTF